MVDFEIYTFVFYIFADLWWNFGIIVYTFLQIIV